MTRESTPAAEHRAAVANLLMELPEDAAFSSTFGQAFVTLPHINQTFALADTIVHDWFRERFHRSSGHPLTSRDLHQILTTLRARAHCNARRYVIGTRLAGRPHPDPAVYLDLCNNESESVTITKDGWEITKTSEVFFHSTRGQLPLPRPEAKESPHSRILEFLNSHPGINEWLLAALQPSGPYPILILHGPPNSGKSTLAKMLRSLIDPVTAPLLPLPSRQQAISKLATRHRVLAFDHVTHMSPTATDALCRISSGCGIEAADTVQLEIARPIIITTPRNGIGDWIPRANLASRSIAVLMPAIDTPRPEHEILSEFESARPALLAILLTALSESLSASPSWNRPPGLSLRDLYESSAHADPLFNPILALPQPTGEWTGTATGLLNEICVTAPVTCSTARALSQRLNILTPALIASGLQIEHHHKHGGAHLITLRLPKQTTPDSVTPYVRDDGPAGLKSDVGQTMSPGFCNPKLAVTWRTHSCVPRSHSCERVFPGSHRASSRRARSEIGSSIGMWGRLLTCGRLLIGLPKDRTKAHHA